MWGRTWWVTGLLFVLILGGVEVGWRAEGHVPSVVDDLALWSEQLSRVDADPRPQFNRQHPRQFRQHAFAQAVRCGGGVGVGDARTQ